jgi:hypothetical protein
MCALINDVFSSSDGTLSNEPTGSLRKKAVLTEFVVPWYHTGGCLKELCKTVDKPVRPTSLCAEV